MKGIETDGYDYPQRQLRQGDDAVLIIRQEKGDRERLSKQVEGAVIELHCSHAIPFHLMEMLRPSQATRESITTRCRYD